MWKILIPMVFLFLPPAWANDIVPASPGTNPGANAESKCGDWEQFAMDSFIVQNNVWNKKDLTNYRQCLFQGTLGSKTVFGWEWRWPDSRTVSGYDDVWAYPEIIFGWKPWSPESTTAQLPRRVKNIGACVVTYDIDMKKDGVGNLAFDLWLTRKAVPAEDNISMELMIWLENTGQQPDGSYMGIVKIDGAEYDFYKGHPSHAGWGSTAFLRRGKSLKGTINLNKFLEFLVKNRHLSKDDYLASIEFGNEICGGTGRTEFQEFRVEMKAK